MNPLLLLLLTGFTCTYASDAPTDSMHVIELDPEVVKLIAKSSGGPILSAHDYCASELNNRTEETIPLIPFYKKTYTFGRASSNRQIMKLATPVQCTWDFDIVSLDKEGTVAVWWHTENPVTPRFTFFPHPKETVGALAAYKDTIYTGNNSGVVQLFDITKTKTGIVCALSGGILEILCDDLLYIAYENNNIALVDKKSGKIEKVLSGKNPNEQILKIMLDPADSNQLCVYDNCGSGDCWDLRTGTTISTGKTHLDDSSLNWIVGTPAIQYLYSTQKGLFKRDGVDVRSLGTEEIGAATWHENALFTGKDNATITVHDFKTGERVAQLKDPSVTPSAVIDLAYDHKDNSLYAAHLNGTIVEWKADK